MLKKRKPKEPWRWYSGVSDFSGDWEPQIKKVFDLITEEEYDEFLYDFCGEFTDEEVIKKVLEAEKETYIVEYDEESDGFDIYKA